MQDERALLPQHWLDLMGRDLPEAGCQVLQPVRVEGRKLKLFSGMVNTCLAAGAKVGIELRHGLLVLTESAHGPELPEAAWWDDGNQLELELPETLRARLPDDDPVPCLLVQRQDQLELRPVRVQEHAADLLGPRIVDELEPAANGGPATAVRHVVRGFSYEEFTPERVAELQALVVPEPLAHDPVRALADGDDWIAWKTRAEILGSPEPGDGVLRQRLEHEILAGQAEDGSWDGHVVKTAYGILRALSVRVRADDPRVGRASHWLLEQPEPEGRPGMWMLDPERLRKWDARMRGEEEVEWLEFMVTNYTEEDHDLFRVHDSQQVIPSCTRNHHAGCDAMMHPSATAAMALCACGHSDHRRLRSYAHTMYGFSAMFGYFCSCWGILGAKSRPPETVGYPNFDQRAVEHPVALAAVPYGHGRGAEDMLALAKLPRYPGVHRPDLSDTNGWTPYMSRDTCCDGYIALDGAYWENADCWAKPNRALALFSGWSGSVAEFLALFQCHLYQTPLGEWNQGYVSGLFRMIEAVTRQTRTARGVDGNPLLCFARSLLLRTVPWLRHHQQEDGLWHLDELPRHGEQGRPPDPRLGTYHIADVLHTFGLLDSLRPHAA